MYIIILSKKRIIHSFIKEAYAKYLGKNKIPPKNVIIYRQGIAYNQLIYVENESKLIILRLKYKIIY